MPPKNRQKASPAEKQIARAARDLIPYAVVERPSRDPPPVNANPKRKVVVDLFFPAIANGVGETVTLGQVRTQLAGQTGIPATAQNLVLEYLHFWVQGSTATTASSATSSSSSLQFTEPVFGVQDRDDASPMENACVGIRYPKNVQRFFLPSVAANTSLGILITSSATGVTTGITARIGVTLWGVAST